MEGQQKSNLKEILIILGMCLVIAIYYCLQADPSTMGFYQHDEVGHYLQIVSFWKDPLTFLTDMWARGGYKLLFALSGFGGWYAVVATNALFSVGSCYFIYLIAKHYQVRNAWMVIIFTGFQPLMITLGFRCYPELPATFCTTVLIYQYLKQRYIAVALIASLLFTVRQELAVISILLGVIFIYKRAWLAIACLLIAPLLLNLLGYLKYHDPLFVYHMMVQGGLKDSYARNGFLYLWLMLPDITGIVVFFLLACSAIAFLLQHNKLGRLKKFHMPLAIMSIYFIMHCIFTSKTIGFGRSGGATRFLLIILPIISLFALTGLNSLLKNRNKRWMNAVILFAGIVPGILLFVFHQRLIPFTVWGFTSLDDVATNITCFSVSIAVICLAIFVPQISNWLKYFLPVIVVIYSQKCVTPIGLSAENIYVNMCADWLYSSNLDFNKLYCDHIMFTYYYGLKSDCYDLSQYDSATVKTKLVKNDVLIYETHYGAKKALPDLISRMNFSMIKVFGDTTTRFYIGVLKVN